jgi:three-Cys-motif partner protein
MPHARILWPLPEQSRGKHIVLRGYLGAWIGILGQAPRRLVVIDGYAGPGEYEGGERGSPLIALDVLENHSARARIQAKFVFLFLEEDERRVNHLRTLVEPAAARLAGRAEVHIEGGRFDEKLTALLDDLDAAHTGLAPAFVMVDPFGVAHLPIRLMGRILGNAQAEVFVSFMYEPINRFLTAPEFEPHLDELFGTARWRKARTINDSAARKDFLFGLYEKQLRDVGAKYVMHFELWNGGRLVYAIFFATSSAVGCDRMKQAIWRADPSGTFKFRADRLSQMPLFGDDFTLLERQLVHTFAGREVGIEELVEWIQTDATQFHSNQLRKALKALEGRGELLVTEGTRIRKGTFPRGTLLTIAIPQA